MAQNTDKNLCSQIIYSVYVRSYSREGTFAAVGAEEGTEASCRTAVEVSLPDGTYENYADGAPITVRDRKGSLP